MTYDSTRCITSLTSSTGQTTETSGVGDGRVSRSTSVDVTSCKVETKGKLSERKSRHARQNTYEFQ
jgi:hypothetical protein